MSGLGRAEQNRRVPTAPQASARRSVVSDHQVPVRGSPSEVAQRAAELLDRATEDPAFVQQATQANRRKRGRNEPCWCGSGKKYKRCHWHADRADGSAGVLTPLSDQLERLCAEVFPRPDPNDLESYERLLALASIAWNRSRMPLHRRGEGLQELQDGTADDEERVALLALLEHLTAVAERLAPKDPRMVLEARFVDRGDFFQILVSHTRPG